MDLYTFSYMKRKETGFLQVIAESQEILQNDGYKMIDVEIETVFSIDDGHSESIHFSMIFETES